MKQGESNFKSFSQIIGQEKAIGILRQVMERDRIPHAYLFVGIPGIGKRTTAMAFARFVNCKGRVDGDGCGRCVPCRQIMGGNFPDLEQIEPDGQVIKIEQIRELNRVFEYKRVSGRYRVCIIQQAEKMTEEAANAFLKTLEEPAPGNIIILGVTEPLDLLPTIVSRCQQISFRPLPSDMVATWLMENKALDPEKASVLARISEGSLGRALEMAEDDYFERRQDDIFKINSLQNQSPVKALETVLEFVQRDRKGSGGDDSTTGVAQVLTTWKTWYRDLLLLKVEGPEDLLFNVDFSQRLKNTARNLSIESLIKSILLLDQAQRDILRARNRELVMENAVLTIKEEGHGQGNTNQ
ncbi:MAG: DNA polymerase III subunit delta' [Deltaproteobacteria bacterium]|nr:DNA polymerase III subunit delta' [Deltaproteobacteria bacterium]MBW2137612.1 DNA polymerase III subunit delta' [Deltaproteobacteria bacterium]